jgi:hypothetical protein
LSILLPVYKVEAYLNECASSILQQADSGVEIVFLNDASPDTCPQILESLQRLHPHQIRVIEHGSNQGISAARNTLLQAAQGRYIWFIDSDDVLARGALSELKSIIDTEAPDLVLCDFQRLREDGHARSQTEHIHSFEGTSGVKQFELNSLLTGLFKTGQWHPWSKIVRRSRWPTTLRFPVGRMFEDLALYPRLVLNMRSFYHAPRIWLGYRERPGSALTALTALQLTDWMAAMDGYADEIRQASFAVHADTQFKIAMFCARTFTRAARKLASFQTPDSLETLSRWPPLWERSSPLSFGELMHNYVKRGYWFRALQFFYWMQRSRRS